jgi:hypothetical protein
MISSCDGFRDAPAQLSPTSHVIGDFLSPCERKEVVGASFNVVYFLCYWPFELGFVNNLSLVNTNISCLGACYEGGLPRDSP